MSKSALTLLVAMAMAAAIIAPACRDGEGPRPSVEQAPVRYHCRMHPSYISDRPGTCPICGMDLVPIEPSGEVSGNEEDSHRGDRAVLTLTPERLQLLGVRSDEVREV
ncbi:MAG TPA: heavy metal-binding domain-containing protein, partial [Vicinamibacteria bacterium]